MRSKSSRHLLRAYFVGDGSGAETLALGVFQQLDRTLDHSRDLWRAAFWRAEIHGRVYVEQDVANGAGQPAHGTGVPGALA